MTSITLTINLPAEDKNILEFLAPLLGLNAKQETAKVSEKPAKVESKATLKELKAAGKKLKETHGEAAAFEVLASFGYESKGSIAKTLASCELEDYAKLVEAFSAYEPKQEEIAEADDDWGDDEEELAPTVDTVKTALRAYRDEHGGEKALKILTDHGLGKFADVGMADSETLKKIYDIAIA